ncbi:bifunctional tetrahydrofolate synthase/dihydrofolate synthase [Halomonas sp. PAMB 3264]|uniref:bifunctional tetrahydrofolate synthase/dihydrofolate synthase n=1 Tax=Halomonas sp. PAMB 3264 TaxID=3075222 RepID=UPI00289EA76D|nr:bifunctional tetrahydrofolate synthase/dihydrofolate synthase [Halomonas sp. PAMB 3264]WNL40882.1 bifunctional tetrahydrofolate synthase/dihydrofolate synthase [Halomonas sp. PAMB 3264]
MPDTLAGWLEHLETLHPVGIDMGLERVSNVAERMGLLERPVATRVVMVAGTNGKGSTLAMMEVVARAHGYRTGTYTSPHLVRYNERVTINGQLAGDTELIEGFERVEKARTQEPAISLTYFEAGTLCALWCLSQQALDLAFLEVGLGGRLDAVNIVEPDVSIVTTVALDHADYLGTDIEQIGREKAGIFRPLKPAVLGSRSLPVSVAETAIEMASTLHALGVAFKHSADAKASNDLITRWCWHGLTDEGDTVSLDALIDPGLPIDNAATALQALALVGVSFDAALVNQAFRSLIVAGRMQWIGQWCLDVGHNPHAARYVASRLPTLDEGARQWALIGMLKDKDADGVLEALMPCISDWVCVSLDGERGRPAEDLAERIRAKGGVVHALADSPTQGVDIIGAELDGRDRVLAMGSFKTVAALLEYPLPQA